MNFGETLQRAVEREVLEETGLESVANEHCVWVGQFIGPTYHYTVIDFIAWVPHFTKFVCSTGLKYPRPGDDAAAVAWVHCKDLSAVGGEMPAASAAAAVRVAVGNALKMIGEAQ